MENKLRIGVAGAGHLGSLHIKMYKQIPNIELVGFFDTDESRKKNIQDEYNIKPFDNFQDLLNEVDAVSIVTPTKDHFDSSKIALESGKHIFIEKPITETISQAKQLIEIAEKKRLKIQIGHIERFNPAILSLEKYNIEPLFIESHRLDQFKPRGVDVAVVLDLMIHDIDIILSLIKSPVERVDANGIAIVSESLDIANARIKFQNGSVANVTASRISQKKMRKMRIFQRDAYISIDFSQGLAELFRLAGEDEKFNGMAMNLGQIEKGKVKRNIIYEQPDIKEVNALKYELSLFIDSVVNDKLPLVSGNDGLRALEVADMIMQQIKQQKFQ
jgi:predicted dehydrogenase